MLIIFILLSSAVFGQQISIEREKATVVKGTKIQIEWAEKEMACFIHWNIEMYTTLTAGFRFMIHFFF